MMCAMLTLLFILTLCVSAMAEDVTGTWYLNSVQINGLNQISEDMLNSELEINWNNEWSFDFMDDEESGTWEKTNTGYKLTDTEGKTSVFTMETKNGVSLLSAILDGDILMEFSHEKAFDLNKVGEPYGDVLLSDFKGQWQLFCVAIDDIQLPLGTLGLNQFDLNIDENGKVTFMTKTYNGKTETNKAIGKLVGNRWLTVETNNNDYPLIELVMHEGMEYISWTMDNETVCYFKSVDD